MREAYWLYLHIGNALPLNNVAQVQYSVLDRRALEFAPLCRDTGLRLLCYGSLAGGFLTDKWLGKPEPGDELENRSLVKYKCVAQPAPQTRGVYGLRDE
jgi:aryl-alcohol dehydrogenase-like predicted oxidoreductase